MQPGLLLAVRICGYKARYQAAQTLTYLLKLLNRLREAQSSSAVPPELSVGWRPQALKISPILLSEATFSNTRNVDSQKEIFGIMFEMSQTKYTCLIITIWSVLVTVTRLSSG